MTLPSKSPITLPFGATTDPYTSANPHKGTDFSYSPDNIIYAPFSGKVTLVPNNGNDGNGLYMTAANGDFHGLLHSSKYLIANGASVTEGQPIAVMGDTGYAFGVHLHWAVKRNGVFIDPMSLVKEDAPVPYIAPETIKEIFKDFEVVGQDGALGVPSQSQIDYYSHHPAGYAQLYEDVMKFEYDARKAAESQSTPKAIKLEPGIYQV